MRDHWRYRQAETCAEITRHQCTGRGTVPIGGRLYCANAAKAIRAFLARVAA